MTLAGVPRTSGVLTEGGPRAGGCCSRFRLNEDNGRFLLLGAVLLLYLTAGAALFRWAERDNELRTQRRYLQLYGEFRSNLTVGSVPSVAELDRLLDAHLRADRLGLMNHRPQWDFSGAFHFSCTVVSTIGWGWTAPQTSVGRICLILYGIFGCAGGILFFNLFLERFITLLSHMMRVYHSWQIKRQVEVARESRAPSAISRAESMTSQSSQDYKWKPSVYWVLLFLLVCTALVLQLGATLYFYMERWDYLRAVYYSFVSFATIGFGDLVAGIRPDSFYGAAQWYGVANFLVTVLGVCCMYSLFNIVSIIIKQLLNCVIRYVDGCFASASMPTATASVAPAELSEKGLGRVSQLPTPQLSPDIGKSASSREDMDAEGLANDRGTNRTQDVIFTNELMHANRVSLAVMQKRLYESVQQSRANSALANGRLGERDTDCAGVNIRSLGSVAIASEKLDSED